MLLTPYPCCGKSHEIDEDWSHNVMQHALFMLGYLYGIVADPSCTENCKICAYNIPIPRELYEFFYNILRVDPRERISATDAIELLRNYSANYQPY